MAFAVFRTAASDPEPHDDHGYQQPEKRKRDSDETKRMHEPRLAEITKVLVDQPEHPAEEHEGYQLSQRIYHGYNYSINRLLEKPVGESNMLAKKREARL